VLSAILNNVLSQRNVMRLRAVDHYFRGEAEIRLLSRLCERTRIALDIGANVGVYTYFMRRYARHVYAYEPNPGLADRLARLFPDVTVRCAAVSDSFGELTLRIPVREGRLMHELGSVAQSFDRDSEVVEHRIPSVTIDSDDCRDVGFVKIDVEQHEIAVLQGMAGTLVRDRPCIMTEVCVLLYKKDLRDMFKFITDNDYNGFFRFRDSYIPLEQFVPEKHANPEKYGIDFMGENLIFIPSERDASFLWKGSEAQRIPLAKSPASR
jgi:FkbM family methyltransferase